MNELQKMTRKIRLLSLFIGGTLSILAAIIWHDKIAEVAGGVVIGLMCALIGFQMIQSMSLGIEESNAKSKAYVGYLLRCIPASTFSHYLSALCVIRQQLLCIAFDIERRWISGN